MVAVESANEVVMDISPEKSVTRVYNGTES